MRADNHRHLLRFASLILVLSTLSLGASAQVAAKASPYAQGLLWKIEGRAREPSYVFGTIHISDRRVTDLPAPVRRSFDEARTLAVEVTLEPVNMMQAADRMIYRDGRDLRAVIGALLYEKVLASAGSLGLPAEALRSLKPWAVALLLSVPESDPASILDFVLQRSAAEQKKSVHSLETADEQVDIFDRLSERDQVVLLAAALESRERFPALVERMVSAYLARDLAALNRLNEEEYGTGETRRVTTRLMQQLLFDRNVRMAQRAEALFNSGSAFVAVGALHLYGERGVLAELAKRGHRVSRVY